MKKIDMYKEVPEQFHNRLCDTLEQLEEEKIVKFSPKRIAVACAVALLATSTITVGAVELFKWYRAASDRFGTTEELEQDLTNQGAAIPAKDSDVQQDITMTALQAVKTDKGFYFLAGLEWPEELEWNDDILYESCNVTSAQEFDCCTANFAGGPDEAGIAYVEIEARCQSNTEYTGQAVVTLTDLIQTKKTAYVDTLVEGQWELVFDLPVDAAFVSFASVQDIPVAGHEMQVRKIEISPFAVKLFTEEEQARHATYYSGIQLAAVLYGDGSVVENYSAPLQLFASKDESGNFYFNLPLENAVEVEKVSALLFKENDEEIKIDLKQAAGNQAESDIADAEQTTLAQVMANATSTEGEVGLDELNILYVRYDYAILTDYKNIYLWDAKCGNAEVIADLSALGYDAERGGDIAMMPGGVVMAVYPAENSDKLYMIEMDTFDINETSAGGIWPVSRYEDYKDSFFAVSEKTKLPEGTYAPKGYETQGSAYILYSRDGSLENVELVNLNE